MAKPLVSQPTLEPTRKMFVGAVGAVAVAGLQHLVVNLAGDIGWLSWLNSAEVMSVVPIIGYFGVGYMFREKAFWN